MVDCEWQGSDVSVGARVVLPIEPIGFALAATSTLSLPTGHLGVSSEHVDPVVVVHADRNLGASLELSYNYAVTRIHEDDPDRAWVRHGHGLALGVTAGRWTPYVGVAWRPRHVDGQVPRLAQVGTGVRITRDVQADVTFGRGLNRAEPSWGVSAGISLRRRPR